MNKKGFIGDVPFIVALLVVIGIIWIVGSSVFDSLNTSLQGSDVLTNDSKATISTLETRYVSVFDGVFLLVFGLLALGLVLSTAMLGTRPEFFFIVIIVSMLFIGAAAALSNVFDSVASSSAGSTVSEFTYIPLIMNNLVVITLFLVALLLAGLYVKARGIV
jgi:flagellar biosynthesis protein FlhB